MFYHWELKEKTNDTIDIYRIFDLTKEMGANLLNDYMSIEPYASRKFFRAKNAATFLDIENVPL